MSLSTLDKGVRVRYVGSPACCIHKPQPHLPFSGMMNSNDPSSSSSSASSSNTASHTAASLSAAASSQHRSLKRTADQSGLESPSNSERSPPDAKRAKQQATDGGEELRLDMQHEDEMEDMDSRRVDEQLLMQTDSMVVEGEREQQEVLAKSGDKEGEEDAPGLLVKGHNVEVDKALKYAEDMEDELR